MGPASSSAVFPRVESELQIALIALFSEMLYRFPNMVVAQVTRESVQQAIASGITAQQVCPLGGGGGRTTGDTGAGRVGVESWCGKHRAGSLWSGSPPRCVKPRMPEGKSMVGAGGTVALGLSTSSSQQPRFFRSSEPFPQLDLGIPTGQSTESVTMVLKK